MNFLDGLNKPQKEAVTQKSGAMIVVAGAGSGKTRVITARMANLILSERVDPQSILALTFTNKAAGEMEDRLIKFLSQSQDGQSKRLPFVGTFHAYCLLILRTNPSLLPFSDFSIIDDDDQKSLIKKIIKKNNLEKQVSVREVAYQISKIKSGWNDSTCGMEQATKGTNPLLKEVYLAYESEKAAAHSFDFDDLLLVTLKIFQKNKEFKQKFQSRVRHILVDEYQDTNGVQHALLKEMGLSSGKKKTFALDSLCAVGDEDQSIYSWRGAVSTNMQTFQKDFAPVTLIKIEQNYRSVQPILKAANNVIEHNSQRYAKKLWSEKKARNRILSITCQSGYSEADTISTYLKSLPNKFRLSNTAILYRTHFQSRSIEESLIRNSIPYVIVGGIRFYERKEIRDLLAYMRLVLNPFDRTSLFRIINRPARGLGAKFEELLYAEWNKNQLLDFKQVLKYLITDAPKGTKVTGNKANAIKVFLSIFDECKKDDKPDVVLSNIIEKVDYFSYLRKAYDPQESETKIENVQELIRSVEHFSTNVKEKVPTLENFLYEIALLQEKMEDKTLQDDHVQMMTLHAAKGLEFDTVIISGLEEGMLPSMKSMHDDDALQEERRLFYVGMTRAKERLILTRSLYRNTYGQILDQVVSRFVPEIPSRLIFHIDLTNVHPSKTKMLLAQWHGLNPKLETSGITTFGPPPAFVKANDVKKPKGTTNRKAIKKPRAKTKLVSSTTSFTPPLNRKQKRVIPSRSLPWKKNQVVMHKKFGMGVVKKVEQSSEETYHLTIFFKVGTKRILSKFVDKV